MPPIIRKTESLPAAFTQRSGPAGSDTPSIRAPRVHPTHGGHGGYGGFGRQGSAAVDTGPTPSRHRRFLRELRTKTSTKLIEDAQRLSTPAISVTVVSTAVLTLTFFLVFLFLLYLVLFYAAPDAR